MRAVHERVARPLTEKPIDFHRGLPGYRPTPLVSLDGIADELGAAALWAKVETARFGLPSFKVLGASWAVHRLLAERPPNSPVTLVAATEGNHGRAVAFMARHYGLHAKILVTPAVAPSRIAAIEGEGAEVIVVEGTYDDAVVAAAALADDTNVVVSDTAWPGYEQVPEWVIEGYSTIFDEVAAELGGDGLDVVAVQMGVGSLAAAVIDAYAGHAEIVVAEARGAACGKASAEAGRIVTVPGPHMSVMAGLNCGVPSLVAWPRLRDHVNTFVEIDDAAAVAAVDALGEAGIATGPAGAAGLAALRQLPQLVAGKRALVICTEAPA